MEKDDMTTFLFRLPTSLKEKLSKKAKQENKSVNATLQTIVNESLSLKGNSSEPLEQRLFLGKLVKPEQFDEIDGLVKVEGIYYRYLIESNQPFELNLNYIIIEVLGNILTLRPLKQEGEK
ncbi:Arc family DNA-binding protein [Ligilactobacillus apodemi]|uniref:Arc family DNA-binding protein n=1 Tax=Ligilactobacillus apodemi TaxID=307126 RepID=UPI00214BCB08|nr:Arc family DNA-binding protein [Ligilactobacillus apodemi]MCR1900560.1 Arc family DNA-binding protein [Ligilactobacillus apodemi]